MGTTPSDPSPRSVREARDRRPAARGPAYPETQRLFAVFGSTSRSGYWEPPERLEALSLFGGVKLDFREANLYEGITEVQCVAVFGGVEIIVPSDIEVDANGLGLFGGFDHRPLKKNRLGNALRRLRSDERGEDEGEPPLLRIRGFALFGGVTVRVK